MFEIPFSSFGSNEAVDIGNDSVLQDRRQDDTFDGSDEFRGHVLPEHVSGVPLVDSVDLVDRSFVPFNKGVAEALQESRSAGVLIHEKHKIAKFFNPAASTHRLADNLVKDSNSLSVVIEFVEAETESECVAISLDVLDDLRRIKPGRLRVGFDLEAGVLGLLRCLKLNDVFDENAVELVVLSEFEVERVVGIQEFPH